MPPAYKPKLKPNTRVRMKNAPCSRCPPWVNRFVRKGMAGVVVKFSEAACSYWVRFDAYPDTDVGICPKHLEPV
jgi:hypothetical protein